MSTLEGIDWLISVDDHLLEPGTLWADRLPAKYREVGPRLVRDEQGEAWHFENKRIPTVGLMATAGKEKDDFSLEPITYDEMRSGCYDAKARLEDMNRDHVLASACFPSFPRFCGQTFYEANDHELGMLCVKAWNDFVIDEWAGDNPGRFIPLILIPLWDPTASAREIERCAAKGAKGVIFSENPAELGLPSIHSSDRYWDPMFAAANETGLPICTHIGSSSKLPTTSDDAPALIPCTLTPLISPLKTCVDWIFSGLFYKFPNLKLCLSEGGIGWIPHALMWMDHAADTQRWARNSDFSLDVNKGDVSARERVLTIVSDDKPPSALFREHVYGCFITDPVGVEHLDLIGEDNVMLETDYPHSDSTWPNSLQNAEKELAILTPSQRHKVTRGNASRLFNFTPAELPV